MLPKIAQTYAVWGMAALRGSVRLADEDKQMTEKGRGVRRAGGGGGKGFGDESGLIQLNPEKDDMLCSTLGSIQLPAVLGAE